jgi:competence protein ComEC
MIRVVLYFVTGSFALGILVRSFYSVPQTFLMFILVLTAAIVAVLFLTHTSKNTLKIASLCVFGVAVFTSGVLYIDSAFGRDSQKMLPQELIDTKQSLVGVVVQEPDYRETSTRFVVEIEKVGDKVLPSRVSPRILLTTDLYSDVTYGDRLSFFGKIEQPENFESDTGRVFDYIHYLSKDGIFYQMYRPDIQIEGHNQASKLVSVLFKIKTTFLHNLKKFLPEPESSLAGGLIVGAKQSLGQTLTDEFRTVGVIHIVVLSGYNVTLIVDVIMSLLSFLPFILRTVLGIGGIGLFVMLVGAGATVVRAGLMAILVVLARVFGRTTDALYLLMLAAFLMMLYNPRIVAFDISFQLSFLATFGLIVVSPIIERYIQWVPKTLQLREIVVATVSTQLFVLPILIFNVGMVSIISLVVNVLVLMTVPWAMLFGFLTGVLGFLPAVFAWPTALIAEGLLSYELWIVHVFAQIPFAAISLPQLPVWIVFGIYGVYTVVLWRLYKGLGKGESLE